MKKSSDKPFKTKPNKQTKRKKEKLNAMYRIHRRQN